MPALDARTFRDPIDVYAPRELSAMDTPSKVAHNPDNAINQTIVPIIWPVFMESARILACTPFAD